MLISLTFGPAICSADKETDRQEILEKMNLKIVSPLDVQGKKVYFDADTGLSKEEERLNGVKLYWVITGDNLKKPRKVSGHGRSQVFPNGEYDVALLVTSRKGDLTTAETSFTVEQEGNDPKRKGFNRFNKDSEEAQYVKNNVNIEITSPSNTEGKSVNFDADTGLSASEENLYRVKLYWELDGENLSRPRKFTGHNYSLTLQEGEYTAVLRVDSVFGNIGTKELTFTVEENSNV